MKTIKKRFKELNTKEWKYIKNGYIQSNNLAGIKENLIFRKYFGLFYILYENNQIKASASVLNNNLDHLYVSIKNEGTGSFFISQIEFKYLFVKKKQYKTESLKKFYLKNGFKECFTFRKDYIKMLRT